MKKKYNKLVRDRIPEILSEKGIRTKTHLATEKEFGTKLIEKLKEEVDEFLKQENPEELPDILEVLYAITGLHKITPQKLEEQRMKKRRLRGGFDQKIILEETEE